MGRDESIGRKEDGRKDRREEMHREEGETRRWRKGMGTLDINDEMEMRNV